MRGEWFATGDRYRRTEDDYYVYVGRADDMFKVAGLWVSPVDMEHVLLEHPAVASAAVVGTTVDDYTRLAAFVKCNEGESADDELRESLRAWCRDRLREYEYPHIIRFVDELPQTLTGKPQRFKLRELMEQELGSGSGAGPGGSGQASATAAAAAGPAPSRPHNLRRRRPVAAGPRPAWACLAPQVEPRGAAGGRARRGRLGPGARRDGRDDGGTVSRDDRHRAHVQGAGLRLDRGRRAAQQAGKRSRRAPPLDPDLRLPDAARRRGAAEGTRGRLEGEPAQADDDPGDLAARCARSSSGPRRRGCPTPS